MAFTPFASASLYVGDLAFDVTEANLFEVFNSIGAVASIRVCRDAITRRSLGYAYVNYHTTADAERAIDALNNAPIKGKPCRVMWSQRDPALRKSGKGNIFIKNLDKSIDYKTLHDTFSQFGNILSCKVELDRGNESKGYGYVQFATQEAAEKAIEKVNGMLLNGKKVYVGPFVGKKDRVEQTASKQFTNVYVKNLPDTFTEEKLKEVFGKYGEIKSGALMKDDTGAFKGFAFVNYEKPEDAQQAVDALNNFEIDGKAIYVGRAQKKSERESELKHKFEEIRQQQMAKYQGVNLYIKNIDDDFDDDKLRKIFEPFGTVTSCKVMKDGKPGGKAHKGFGFVCYSSPEEATKAITEMNGKIVGSKPLYVALAQRKDQRRAQLEMQFASYARTKMAMPGGRPMSGFYPPGAAAPVFYGAPNQPYMYGQMVPGPRGRFPGGPYQAMPANYVMVGGGRGQPMGKNGGRGGPRGMKPQGGPQQPPQPQQMPVPVPAPEMAAPKLSAAFLASYPPEEQKNILGERLYGMIMKNQPQLAGKITGMILDSCDTAEIINLIDDQNALNEKVDEAMKVLNEHKEDDK